MVVVIVNEIHSLPCKSIESIHYHILDHPTMFASPYHPYIHNSDDDDDKTITFTIPPNTNTCTSI